MKKILFALVFIPSLLFGQISNITQNTSHTTIQLAVDNSVSGDTIIMDPGTYTENVVINSSSIVLASKFLTTGDSTYIDATIIDANNSGSAIVLSNINHTTTILDFSLIGFVMKNGYVASSNNSNGSGLYINHGVNSVVLDRISVISSAAQLGGGVCWHPQDQNYSGTSLIVKNCFIDNNTASDGGGFFVTALERFEVYNSIISNNVVSSDGGGMRVNNTDTSIIVNSTITKNEAGAGRYGAGLWYGGSNFDHHVIFNSIIFSNYRYSDTYETNFNSVQGSFYAHNNFIGNSLNFSMTEYQNNIVSYTSPFVDISNNDFTLTNTSEALGIGINSLQVLGETITIQNFDYNNLARPTPANSSPDLGAFENIYSGTEFGCTDPTACNYDALVIIDDGSCFYGNCVENITQNTFTADIQAGIDASLDGDTLIASQGTYSENIVYNGKDIVIASDFLLNNDTSYISSTIIDGGTGGPTVLFNNQEENAHLIGFTITQGWCGLKIDNANSSNIGPFLTNLYFTNNGTVYSGSSIHVDCNHNISVVVDKCEFFNNSLNQNVIYFCNVNNSDVTRFPLIKNSKFYNNNVTNGVLFFEGDNSKIENCVINDNIAFAGVIYYQGSLSHNLLNSTIVNNSGYGLYLEPISLPSIANIENSVIWGNNSNLQQLALQINQPLNLNIDYSVLQGANNYAQIGNSTFLLLNDNYGSNNLDVDPDLNADNSLSNFSLAIGAGNSSSALSTDILGGVRPNPAGSNPDVGAYENSLATPDILGCQDVNAINYNANANISDSSLCCYVGGCIDPAATNYDPLACFNTVSCNFIINNITQDTGYAVIQNAIDGAQSGDTIIVSAGTYMENIVINKSIVLASEFLLNNDTSYISSTIIDGNQMGSVVVIDSAGHNQPLNTTLKGFTITNGYDSFGAGIEAIGDGIVLENLIVSNNTAVGDLDGGGAYIGGDIHILNSIFKNNIGRKGGALLFGHGSPLIENCQFFNNNCTEAGAVFMIVNCTPTIKNALIVNNGNNGGNNGNMIYTGGSTSNAVFLNSTITGNASTAGGYIAYAQDGTMSFTNSILYNDGYNESGNLYGSFPSSISFTNCNVQGVTISNGNIDVDPDLNTDYSLSNFSLCIGSGTNSGAPSTDILGGIRPNPAGSNSDIGAFENSLATPDILGCMDPTSLTYNSNANVNDSSLCCYLSGCSDPGAINYDGSCLNDGSCLYAVNNITQNTSFTTIQPALDASVDGDTIIISPGTYYENIIVNTNIVLASEHLLTNDTSYISSTIIDGGGLSRVIRLNHVNSSDSIKVTIDGLSVTNGDFPSDYGGGGIYMIASGGWDEAEKHKLILSNLNIYNNNADNNQGGGVYTLGINTDIINCTFSNNTSDGHGAGFYLQNSSSIISNSTFLNNISDQNGGAFHVQSMDSVFVLSCHIFNNTANDRNGGASIQTFDYLLVDSLDAHNNYGDQRNGGLYAQGGDNIKVLNSTFFQNTTDGDGAGLMLQNIDSILISNSVFRENLSDLEGAALYIASGNSSDIVNIIDCQFINNTGRNYAGGCIATAGEIKIQSSIIDSNLADGGSSGGMWLGYSDKVEVINTQVRYNESDGAGAGLYFEHNDSIFISNSNILYNDANNASAGGIYIGTENDYANISNTNIVGNEANVGGIMCYSDELFMNSCRIDSNISNGSTGGLFLSGNDNVQISNCLFTNNEANDYAAIYSDASEFILRNSTVANNTDNSVYTASIGFGGGSDDNLIFNSIIYEPNHPTRDIYIGGGNLSLYNNLLYHTSLSGYNGNLPIVDSNNVFSTIDPFLDLQNGNYSLTDSSFAIGAGIDSVVFLSNNFYSSNLDYANLLRPTPANSNPDIGVYENLRATPMILGCMDTLAFNFNILANENDSSLCCYLSGCIDPIALNYDSVPCYSDESCTYSVTNITQNTGSNIIQNVVDLANSGDTIIMNPGTYTENVIINSSIVLASKYLTTADSTYIDLTIIDANNTGSALTINNSSTNIDLIGFVMKNGNNHNGGGVYINNANIVNLEKVSILSSTASYDGGGLNWNSNNNNGFLNLSSCLVDGNIANGG